MSEQLSILPKREPEELLSAAFDWEPIRSFCMFSGGNDSTVLAHRCRDHYDTLFHIDTGTAVPGVRTFVEDFAKWIDKPLVVYESKDAFRRLVLGDDVWWSRFNESRTRNPTITIEEFEERDQILWGQGSGQIPAGPQLGQYPHGFPGPGAHGRVYTRLKERRIEDCVRDAKRGQKRTAHVALLSGKRRAESKRRGQTTMGLEFNGGQMYVNPLIDWTTFDMVTYRRAHKIPQSDVAALLHRSGECNCGAFAEAGEERAMLKSLWPAWWSTIEDMERLAEQLGIRWCRWGGYDASGMRSTDKSREKPGIACSDCQTYLEMAA